MQGKGFLAIWSNLAPEDGAADTPQQTLLTTPYV